MYEIFFVRQQLQTWPQRETLRERERERESVCVCVCVYMRNFTFSQSVRKQIFS